jgi:hypothetical protein
VTVLRARAVDDQGNPVQGRTASLEPYGANRYVSPYTGPSASRALTATSGADGWMQWTLPDPQRRPGPKGFYWVIKGLESAPVVAATQPGDATVTLDDTAKRVGTVSTSGELAPVPLVDTAGVVQELTSGAPAALDTLVEIASAVTAAQEIVLFDDAAMRYPAHDGAALYLGPLPPPANRTGLYVNQPPVEPHQRYFTGLWQQPLASDHPLEDRADFNGTADFTNNRNGTPYATRLANLSTYSTTSTPVAGLYARGDNTVIGHDAAPLYIIPNADHPRQPVVWMTNNGAGPAAPDYVSAGLQTKLASVPVPTGPAGERFDTFYGRQLAAAGSDQQLVIYDSFTHEMWEFWLFSWNTTRNRYECGYAGYVADALIAPEALPNLWGARATSLPLHPSVLTRVEWEEGVIRHPIGLSVQTVKSGFLPPATREDAAITAHTGGADARDAVPEGAWFRLPASYMVDTNRYPTNPGNSKMFAMITRAARDYGLIVTDGTGGTMDIAWEADNAIGTPYSPLAVSTLPVQADYNSGPYYGNGSILAFDFPWSQLVQLKYMA